MDRIELIVITSEAEYDGQSYGYRLTCRAEDWDAEDWLPQHYVYRTEQQIRQSVPAHVPIRTTIRRETLEGDGS